MNQEKLKEKIRQEKPITLSRENDISANILSGELSKHLAPSSYPVQRAPPQKAGVGGGVRTIVSPAYNGLAASLFSLLIVCVSRAVNLQRKWTAESLNFIVKFKRNKGRRTLSSSAMLPSKVHQMSYSACILKQSVLSFIN